MTRKTIFEWAELFQNEIQAGTSQSNIIQMLEDYKKEQQTIASVSGKQLPLDFVKWYSGMDEEKILKAFNKWGKEVVCASGAVDKTVSGDTVKKCMGCGEELDLDYTESWCNNCI